MLLFPAAVVMEKSKPAKRRAVGATNNATSGTVLTPTTTTASTTSVDDAFKDFVDQLSNPATVADFNRQVGDEGITAGQHQQQSPHQSIQTCLDQLGNDISVIKSNLEKRKTKISLLDVNEKVDQILQFLKDRYSPVDSDNSSKMEP